jgi:hypothetical protein
MHTIRAVSERGRREDDSMMTCLTAALAIELLPA